MPPKFKLKIATLNVKGLNERGKQQKTLTLLKSYNLDIIMIQETNLNNENTRNFLKHQWIYDSFWSDKVAILAGNKNITFKDTKIDYEGRVITASFVYKSFSFLITNVYAPPSSSNRTTFFDKWALQV